MRKAELEGLLNALVPHAERMLAEFGEFVPYAGAVTRDGSLQSVSPPDVGAPDSLDAWERGLVEGLRIGAASGTVRATGLVLNVEVDVPGKEAARAIRVALEHETGVSYHVFIPYWFEENRVSYGSALAARGNPQVFVSEPAPEPVPLSSGA